MTDRTVLGTVDSVRALPTSAWHTVRDRVRSLVAAEVARQLKPVVQAQEQQRDREFTVDLLLGVGHRINRTLRPSAFATLVRQITTITASSEQPEQPEQPDVAWAVRRAYLAVLDAEMRGLGRIAGSTYNILGKLVTPPLLGAPDGPVLEIGSLYGQFSPLLVRQFRHRGSFRSLTVVDPFAGLQVQRVGRPPHADRTGTPVTEQVARRNLLDLGMDPDEVTVINGFSTEVAVQDELADERFAVIVVDGDHSEEGVYADLVWASEIAAPGALVIMDDFGDRKWPAVERGARRFLTDRPDVRLVGRVATSAFLRVPG